MDDDDYREIGERIYSIREELDDLRREVTDGDDETLAEIDEAIRKSEILVREVNVEHLHQVVMGIRTTIRMGWVLAAMVVGISLTGVLALPYAWMKMLAIATGIAATATVVSLNQRDMRRRDVAIQKLKMARRELEALKAES